MSGRVGEEKLQTASFKLQGSVQAPNSNIRAPEKLQIPNPKRPDCGPALPKLPGAFPNYPEGEKEVGDGVGGHGVAETIFADREPLISHATKDTAKPLVM